MESPKTSKTIKNAPISTTTATSSDHVTVQMFEACEGCGKDAEVISAISVNTEFNDMEASQQKCGIRRRGLFEEALLNTIADSSSSSNLSNISKSPASISNTENIEFSRDVSTPTSSNRKLINLHQSVKTIFSPHNAGNSSLTVPKPTGIGLHLNSIVSALPMNYIANASSHVGEKDCIKIERMNPASRMNYHLPENINIGSISSSIADDVLASSEDGMSSLIAASSTTSESCYRAKKPLDNSLLKPQESSAIAHKKRKFQSEHAESFEHHNQSIPKKKMTMAFSTSDGEGCKRCNCKRTKCLKLYCDCFAAGSYCTEACACQGCFNRPEYEDTVHETRQQIESRNPLAFVPKVLQTVSESPADILEELSRLAPSSARHKRGCNCKKSMCLKKYCECYQANVGCSDGCRCEGCKNVHGRKEDHGLIEESVRHDPLLSSGKEMVDIVSYDRELFNCVLERVDPSSPSYDGLINLYNDTPSIATVSSASYGSEVELCPGNGRLSSGGSLRWCSSPITPMTQIDDTKVLQGIDSNSGVYDILEDGTPDILKESIPIKTVNVSSPIRKRVSLPYKQLHNLGSSSSGGLRSRKFILQAVPSFPPLAMCINAKGSTHQNKSDIQEDSINK